MTDRSSWSYLRDSMPYLLRRLMVGMAIFTVGILFGFGFLFSINNPPEHLPGLLIIFMWLIGGGISGSGIIYGLGTVVEALWRTLRIPRNVTPEATVRRFLEELYGRVGEVLPPNPSAAFFCLSPEKQKELGNSKALVSARAAFEKSLKVQHHVDTVYEEMGSRKILAKADMVPADEERAWVDVTLGFAIPISKERSKSLPPVALEFELIKQGEGWHISSFKGGLFDFLGRTFLADLSDPRVQKNQRQAYHLILVGWLLLSLGIIIAILVWVQVLSPCVLAIAIPVAFGSMVCLDKGYRRRARYQ